MGLLGNVAINVLKHSAYGTTLCLVIAAASADEANPSVSFKGFGTLGTFIADQPGFRRDLSQNTNVHRNFLGIGVDSRLGLQLDLDFHNPLHATVQWVARDHAGDFFEQNLERAFLKWSPRSDLDFRFGRIGTPGFLLADYRNVGYAFPWMRPPQEFYSLVVPNHLDGGSITWKRPVGDGHLSFVNLVGRSLTQVPLSADLDLLMSGTSLIYENNDWRIRLDYVRVEYLTESQNTRLLAALHDPGVNGVWSSAANLARNLSTKHKALHYGSLGVAYDNGIWLAQGEAAYIDTSATQQTANALLPNLFNGYLSLGRRIGRFTPYVLFSMTQDIGGTQTIPAPATFQNGLDALFGTVSVVTYQSNQKSLSLGMRWDFYENTALKIDWNHAWFGHRASTSGTPSLQEEANALSLGIDFVF